jgi:hypothetical protein
MPVFLLTGDFNQVNSRLFNKHACFKQIVVSPTRGSNVLDKMITNNCESYCGVLPSLASAEAQGNVVRAICISKGKAHF